MILKGCYFDLTDRERWVAIVGSRKAPLTDLQNARKMGYMLAKQGFTVVSGLAIGIDIEAHLGALDAGGKTIALLSHCVEEGVYPIRHTKIAERIQKNNGAILYCYDKPAFAPKGEFFGQRQQRLVERSILNAYLCPKIFIPHASTAPIKGGTRYATWWGMKFGREVFRLDADLRPHKDPEVESDNVIPNWNIELDFGNMEKILEATTYKRLSPEEAALDGIDFGRTFR